MASDELKTVLEDVKVKFDTVIDALKMLKETLDRYIEESRKEHQEFKMAILNVVANVSVLKTDVSEIRKDLNDHRDNTELHAGERRKKA
jgi:phage shock protein A